MPSTTSFAWAVVSASQISASVASSLPPPHIVADTAFKEHCSLLNNTDFIAELFFRVILYILAVYHDVTAGRIVETGNQADQRRFSASGTADDSDGLSAFCGKADIR